MVVCLAALLAFVFPSEPAAAARREPARIGDVAYDRGQSELLIPVDGAEPELRLVRLAPRQYVAEIRGGRLEARGAQGRTLHGATLAGWSIEEVAASQIVRVRMSLTADVRPQVRFDRNVGCYIVRFANPAVAASAPRKPAPTATPAMSRGQVSQGLTTRRLPAASPRPATPIPARVVARPATPVPTKTVAKSATPAPAKATARPATPAPARVATRPATPAPARAAARPARPAPPPAAARAVEPPATSAAAAAPVRLGVPVWDARRGVLAVPIAGTVRARDLDVYRLSARWSYLDIPNARPTFGGVRYEDRSEPLLRRWVMAKRPGRDVTRVSLALGARAGIDVEVRPGTLLIAVRPLAPLLATAPEQPAAAARPRPVPVAEAHPPRSRPVRAAVATVPAARPDAPRPPPPASETRLGRPYYDAARYALALPFEGPPPKLRWHRRDSDGARLELLGDTELPRASGRDGELANWRLTRGSGTATLELVFARASELVVTTDGARRELLLIPQPRVAAADPLDAARTLFGAAAVGDDGATLFLPYEGELPRFVVRRAGPRFAHIDFEQAAVRDGRVQFHAPAAHPVLGYWMLSPREGGAARVSLALERSGAIAVYRDPRAQRLVFVVNPDEATEHGDEPRLPEPWPGYGP